MSLVFDPLVIWPVIWALAGVALLLLALALWRGLSGWALRGLSALALLAALANPSLQQENRAGLDDIVILIVDDSASQGLGGRGEQVDAAVARITAEVDAMPGTELRIRRFADGEEDAGTLAMTAMAEALAEEPRARVAGVLLVTDGRVHDMQMTPSLPAPLHVLLTGKAADWDRRLVIRNAPAFAIIGEEFTLKLMVEDVGAVPASAGAEVDLTIAVDAEEPQVYTIPVGVELDLPVTLPHGGMNVLQFSVAPVAES